MAYSTTTYPASQDAGDGRPHAIRNRSTPPPAVVIADHDTDIIGQPVPRGGIDSTHTDRTLVDREAVVEAVEYDGGGE